MYLIVGLIVIISVGSVVFLLISRKGNDSKVEDELNKQVDEEERLYEECMARVEVNEQLYENAKKQVEDEILECERAWIKSEGFNDDLDCIDDYDNPICKDVERYNAEVYGGNHCAGLGDDDEYGEAQREAGIQESYEEESKRIDEILKDTDYKKTLDATDCYEYAL